jgi:hypothetical protein
VLEVRVTGTGAAMTVSMRLADAAIKSIAATTHRASSSVRGLGL